MAKERRKIDPETLSHMSLGQVASLQDIFCNCMQGKVALVTGGASGLGYMVVNRLCEAGAKVVIASRKEERGRRAVSDFEAKGYTVHWVKTDVSKVADCYAAVEETVKTYGGLDVLVTCAAGCGPGGMVSAGVFTEGAEAFSLYGPEYAAARAECSKHKTPVAMNPDMVALAVFALCTPMSDFMQGETVNLYSGF